LRTRTKTRPRRNKKWIVAGLIAIAASVGVWLFLSRSPHFTNETRAHLSACMAATAETRYVYVIYILDHKTRPTRFSEFEITVPVDAPDLLEIEMRPTGFDARCGKAASSATVQYTYAMNNKGVLGWSCEIAGGFDPGFPMVCE
jgi:hypothetical protein